MFNVGDKIKVTQAAIEKEFAEWKGSQVFENMAKAANERHFEVISDNGTHYMVKRCDMGDDAAGLHSLDKGTAHSQFEKVSE